jgi:hypothetical protein
MQSGEGAGRWMGVMGRVVGPGESGGLDGGGAMESLPPLCTSPSIVEGGFGRGESSKRILRAGVDGGSVRELDGFEAGQGVC